MKILIALLGMALGTTAFAQDESFFDTTGVIEGGIQRTCGKFMDYEQPLRTFGSARTSDEQITLEVAENIVSGTTVITLPPGTTGGLRVWGLSLEFNAGFIGQCLEDNAANTPFNVRAYANNAGVPGALLATTTATPTAIVDTGIPFALGANVFEYDLEFNTPFDNTNVSWISIQRQTGQQAGSGNDCYFLWVNETDPATHDNFAIEINTPTTAPNDQAFCLSGAADPVLNLGMITEMDICASDPGNQNGIIEPGETVNFTIPLNASNGAFTNVVGTLTSGSAGVTVVAGMGAYGNIADGGTASATYSIMLEETVACDSIINLTLAVSSTEGNFAFPITRNVGQTADFTYNGLPAAIPDNNPAGVSRTADVSGVPGPITNVEVQVNVTHTWVGDVSLRLTSPGGTVVTLLDRPGVPTTTFGCNNENINVRFADGQPDPESICGAADTPWPVTDASPVPGNAMADFNGEDANGAWTLTAVDSAGGDTGTIVDWELFITPAAVGTCEICAPADADISIVKTAVAPNPLLVGDTITYTLAASNAGPGPASNVVVTDPLPANVTYVSNTCGAAFAAPTVTWTIGALASGANVSCDVVVTVSAPGPITNTATITADQIDPDTSNNASTSALVGGVAIPEAQQVPTLSVFTLAALAALMLGLGLWMRRRYVKS